MKKFMQDLLVTFFGAITSLITAIILVFVELEFELVIYSWMMWFVIPVGAIGSGFVAASGYYFGSKIFNHKPGGMVLLNMVLISLGTYLLINYLIYLSLSIDGVYISEYAPFLKYLDISIKETSMQFFTKYNIGHPVGTGRLGSWGYIVAILQIIGFGIGGFSIFGWLVSLIYCEKCSKYFFRKGKQIRYFSDPEIIKSQHQYLNEHIKINNIEKAIEKHATEGNIKPEKKDYLSSRVELRYCKGCGKHHLKYIASRQDKNDNWNDINETELEAFTDTELALPAGKKD